MAQNYILLERIELAASAASVTFSNIPQSGYTDLKVVYSARVDSSAQDVINISLNGISSGFSSKLFYGLGSSTGSQSSPAQQSGIMGISNSTANTFSNGEMYIFNYLSSSYKNISSQAAAENNATSAVMGLFGTLWSNTAAINSVTLTPAGGNFVANSTFSLYGLAAVGTTPAAPKAEGGDVFYSDGTYWYHFFKSSGTFTALQPLSCDILQVAGGGGGGGGVGGGGGAGGVLGYASQSVSGTVSVTVGAGGGRGTGNGTDGATNGGNSQFGLLTASVGGGKGGSINAGQAGANGGSGGGGAGSNTYGTGTSGQGSNGATTSNAGGGGGGKGGAGSAGGSSLLGGDGGASVNTVTNWGTLSSISSIIGVSGYIAGGGGGSGNGGSTGGIGGGGGATNGGSTGPATDATANTGSGGGGGGYEAGGALARLGGNGGSGVVVVRYAV